MNYILRIFFNNTISDIDLSNLREFSIGSGESDEYSIADFSIQENHVYFEKVDNQWRIICNSTVYYGGEIVTSKIISEGDLYILCHERKIAISIMPIQNSDNVFVDISKYNKILIGRNYSCDIVLNNSKVSANHIQIYKNDVGFRVVDLNSSNGTYLNGERLNDSSLQNQDVILVDMYKIVFFDEKLYFFNEGTDLIINVGDVAQQAEAIDELIKNSKVIVLKKDKEIMIGRGSNCDIILPSRRVSGKHARVCYIGEQYYIFDMKSTNGTYLDGKRVQKHELYDGAEIEVANYRIKYIDGELFLRKETSDAQVDRMFSQMGKQKEPYPFFMRSPRLRLEVPNGEIEIQAPPNIGAKPEINWLSVLVPPLAMAIVMSLIVYILKGSPMTLMFTIPMGLIGIVTSILNYQSQKKKHRKKETLRLERYNNHLNESAQEIESKSKEQYDAYLLAHPETSECLDIAKGRKRRLWERRPQDDDFMTLRLGSGEMDFNMQLRIPKQTVNLEYDDLLNRPYEMADRYKTINNTPILFDMVKNPVAGIVGSRKDGIQLAKNIIVQAATHHGYDELKIVTIFSKKELLEWEWVKWLPHSFDENRSKRYIANDVFGVSKLSKQLGEILLTRLNGRRAEDEYKNTGLKIPFYLFVIADKTLIEDQQIMNLLTRNVENQGIGTLFLYDSISLLPRDCAMIIEVGNQNGNIYYKENVSKKRAFRLDIVTKNLYDSFARCLAPVRIDTMSEEQMLPSCVTFMDGYEVRSPKQIPIIDSWKNSKTYKSMAVPVGVKTNGDPFYFDIHERYHGPHGLVAGMTGSGKSEMVQSWILSMALKFSPQDVSFVLIDFKGTGLILPFLNLPHLAGTISDLDININRNLIALENELSRRKALLDSAGVNNINSYLKLYKAGKAKEHLSFLFLVVDEFAEFKVQFPDFMKVVNRVFAIGRTLGVFAILLTQKPAGVVDDKMHANTRFRWCLKVASSADSKEMLKHPDAAKITNPGRAYIQVGEDEIFELVQTYWSGAPCNPNERHTSVIESKISVVELDGKRVSYDDYFEKTVGFKNEISEIDVMIRHLNKVVMDSNFSTATKIWMPKLADNIPLDAIIEKSFDGEKWREDQGTLEPIVGIVDDPYNQTQYPLRFNISEDGHHVIYGAPSTGKTTLLQTLIMSLMLTYTPADLNLYIMDFGGWGMNIFKNYPHIGGIANDNDNEHIEKMAGVISRELDERKRKFAFEGVGNIAAYKEATGSTIANIVLILDNFAPVINLYPELESFFINLTREGGNYGIYFVTTANNTLSLGFRIGQNIKMAVALQMTEKSDYSSIVGKTDGLEPEKTAGRGLIRGNPPLEFQAALPIEGFFEVDRVSNIKKNGLRMQEKWKGVKAKQIPRMPSIIKYEEIEEHGEENIAIGLSTKDVEPVIIDFSEQHYVIVSGEIMSEKSNMVKVIAKQSGGKHVVFDTSNSALKSMESICEEYITGAKAFDEYIEGVIPILRERKKMYEEDVHAKFEPILIIIDDLKQGFDSISDETVRSLEALVRLGKGLSVNLLVAGKCEDIVKLYNQGEALTMRLVNSQMSILLGGNFRMHNVFNADIPYGMQETPLGEHEGYFVNKGKAIQFKAMREM